MTSAADGSFTFAGIRPDRDSRLGIDADLIRYRYGDSDLVTMGIGTFGSRSAQLAGSAIVGAADKLIDKGRRIAAHMMEAASNDIVFEAGKFVNVIGISRHYAQVKLKSSEIAYVPLTAIDLVKPTDKMFKLTADTAVLTAPTHSAAKIAEVHRGRDVHVVGVALNYMKIRMKDGLEGFIPVHALE